MKIKKIALAALAAATVVTLASCGGETVTFGSMDTHYSGTLKDGFTSLANKNENGELTFQRNDKGEITDNTKATYTVAGKTINVTPVYKTTYTNETSNDQFNYLTNQWSHNSLQYTNMVDGLVSNDKYSNIVGALALGYKVEEKAVKKFGLSN